MSERREGGAQIDLVIERDGGITNICEMKYTDRPLSQCMLDGANGQA